jgi:hypothetical protein
MLGLLVGPSPTDRVPKEVLLEGEAHDEYLVLLLNDIWLSLLRFLISVFFAWFSSCVVFLTLAVSAMWVSNWIKEEGYFGKSDDGGGLGIEGNC